MPGISRFLRYRPPSRLGSTHRSLKSSGQDESLEIPDVRLVTAIGVNDEDAIGLESGQRRPKIVHGQVRGQPTWIGGRVHVSDSQWDVTPTP